MTENTKIMSETEAVENVAEVETATTEKNKQPIMPDAEYTAAVTEDDQEELDKMRKKLMTLIRVKCSSLGKDTIDNQLQPMVYSMNLADCKAMHDALAKKGLLGLAAMVAKHQKSAKKKQKPET